MSITSLAHGSQTAVIGTEHTLADSSAAGTYQAIVDPINMASGDILELRIYLMTLTSGTRRVCYLGRYSGAQPADDLIKVSVPISTELTDSGAVRVTLKQTAGTGRVYPYDVLKFG